jgi:hypothetical protein
VNRFIDGLLAGLLVGVALTCIAFGCSKYRSDCKCDAMYRNLETCREQLQRRKLVLREIAKDEGGYVNPELYEELTP